MRHALGLLEIVVALAILMIALVPLVESFRTSFRGVKLGRAHLQAMLAADAVLEDVRAQVAARLPGYYKLSDSTRDVDQRAAAGAWQTAFIGLAEPRGRMLASKYWQGFAALASDPVAARQYEGFETEVQVAFDAGGAPIDPDGDGTPASDMCQVAVTVFFTDPDLAAPSSYRLAALFGRDDHNRAPGR